MKPISLLATAALALSSAATMAQTYSPPEQITPNPQAAQMQPPTQAPAQMPSMQAPPPSTMPSPSPPAATMPIPSAATTAPTVVETKVDLRTEPGPPADMHAAREEAASALQWAKTEGCRSEPSQRDCIRHAQDEYQATMAQLRSAGVSASGTAQARRSDRQ